MSWKETCPMMERMRFLSQLHEGERDMSDLCRLYGISRKTGYKWRDRFEEGGVVALADRSHARLSQELAVSQAVEQQLVRARRLHPTWGARKLLVLLAARDGATRWPAASTVGEILRRNGLVEVRKRRSQAIAGEPTRLVQPSLPNELWCTDFKGQFRTRDGRYCYPLTLTDAASRYLLACRGLLSPSAEQARPWFERAFREYGLPTTIRSDNGSPFSSTGLGGLSKLAIWWIKLGIVPELIEPGRPQQNGRHERMHRTLKREATRPPGSNLRSQQAKFDRFVEEFNFERPHESLQQRPPSTVYRASSRPYPSRLEPIEYPDGYEVRRIRSNGQIKFAGQTPFISLTLLHEAVGLLQFEEHLWRIYFGMVPLAILDVREKNVCPIPRHPRKKHLRVRGAPPPAPTLLS